MEYSASTTPPNLPSGASGTCSCSSGMASPLAAVGCEYTGCSVSRARPKRSAVSPARTTSPFMRSWLLVTVGAACVARMRRRSSIQVMACNSGYWLMRLSARVTNSLRSSSWLDRSRASRMICSWRSSRRRRTRCWAYSTSRLRASFSRSTSSVRKYQKDTAMAVRNMSTAASGARAAKRSWRVGDRLRHHERHQRAGFLTVETWVAGAAAGEDMGVEFKGAPKADFTRRNNVRMQQNSIIRNICAPFEMTKNCAKLRRISPHAAIESKETGHVRPHQEPGPG